MNEAWSGFHLLCPSLSVGHMYLFSVFLVFPVGVFFIFLDRFSLYLCERVFRSISTENGNESQNAKDLMSTQDQRESVMIHKGQPFRILIKTCCATQAPELCAGLES